MMATYTDLDLTFRAHPVTGDLVIKKDTSAVLQSIRNLIMSSAGEFLWEPHMGGGISKLLFESNDIMLRMQLYDRIKNTITRYEPRVELVELDITSFENGNGINIGITFYILNDPEPISEVIPIRRLR